MRRVSLLVFITASLAIVGIVAYFYIATYQYCIRPQVDPTPLTECDKIANASSDSTLQRKFYSDAERRNVENTCKAALRQNPQSPRLQYIVWAVGGLGEDISPLIALARSCYSPAIGRVGENRIIATFNKRSVNRFVSALIGRSILNKGAKLGDSGSLYTLGELTYTGFTGFSKNEKKGFDLIKTAADKGNLLAMADVGRRFLFQQPSDPASALYYFSLLAKRGDLIGGFIAYTIHKANPALPVSDAELSQWKEMAAQLVKQHPDMNRIIKEYHGLDIFSQP
ncbi:MAG TPA: hypothetical protein VHL08_09420 [Dongiaceae bacterium]|jgi:hypothetical protein|nr:hypothetical protein [Dongiaceae bacterium]